MQIFVCKNENQAKMGQKILTNSQVSFGILIQAPIIENNHDELT